MAASHIQSSAAAVVAAEAATVMAAAVAGLVPGNAAPAALAAVAVIVAVTALRRASHRCQMLVGRWSRCCLTRSTGTPLEGPPIPVPAVVVDTPGTLLGCPLLQREVEHHR